MNRIALNPAPSSSLHQIAAKKLHFRGECTAEDRLSLSITSPEEYNLNSMIKRLESDFRGFEISQFKRMDGETVRFTLRGHQYKFITQPGSNEEGQKTYILEQLNKPDTFLRNMPGDERFGTVNVIFRSPGEVGPQLITVSQENLQKINCFLKSVEEMVDSFENLAFPQKQAKVWKNWLEDVLLSISKGI